MIKMAKILRYKYNMNTIKWLLTIVFLLFNLIIKQGDKNFKIIFGISTNSCAILSFLLLSIFPRKYYVFTINGISYQKRNKKEIWFISWKDVKEIYYEGVGILPVAVVIEYENVFEKGIKALHISYKQYEQEVKYI